MYTVYGDVSVYTVYGDVSVYMHCMVMFGVCTLYGDVWCVYTVW